MKYRKPVKVRGGYKDHYGRVWPYPKNELCPVCGQPDSCGDCNHNKLTDAEVANILYGVVFHRIDGGGSVEHLSRPDFNHPLCVARSAVGAWVGTPSEEITASTQVEGVCKRCRKIAFGS